MRALTLWGGTRVRLVTTTLVLLAAGLLASYSGGFLPAATWRQALDRGTGSTVLIGPVAAGLTAWQYARMRQAGFAEYASATRRDLAGWVGPAVLVWLQACLALVLTTAVLTLTTVVVDIPSHPGDLPIVLQAVAALATYAALGACLGTLVGQSWIAPVAVVLGYLLMLFSVWDLLPGTFDTGSATGSLVGNVFNGRVIALQGVVALGLAAAFAVGALTVLAARHRAVTAVLLVAVCVGAVAYVRLSGTGYDRYAYPDEPLALTCAGSAPEVCVFRDAPRPLEDLATELARQAAALEKLGFDVPARFQVTEFFRRNPVGVGAIAFVDDQEARSEVDPATVSDALGTPADCPAYYANTPDMRVIAVRFLLQDWLADRLGVRRADPDSELGRWMRSPEGLAWARTVYPRLAACEFDGLTVPPVARESR